MLEMEEIPEQDRKLAVSGVGSRVGERVGEGEATSAEGDSTLVLMTLMTLMTVQPRKKIKTLWSRRI